MNRTLSEWVSSYKPVVQCNATCKVEEICAKNGLTFTEFLRPYFHHLDTIKSLSIKTVGRESEFKTFGFRLVHVNEFRPVELNPYDGNQHGFVSDNLSMSELDRNSNSGPQLEHQLNNVLTRSQAKRSNGSVHDSMLYTRELLFESSRYNEFDLTDQPVAIVLAVSSTDLHAEVKMDELRSRAALPSVFRNGIYDKNVQIIHLIVNDHDVTSQMDVLDMVLFFLSKDSFTPAMPSHEEVSLPHIMTKTLFAQMLLGGDAMAEGASNVLSPLAKELLLRLDGQGQLPSTVHGDLDEEQMKLVLDPLNIWADRAQYQAVILNGIVLPTKLPATTWLRLRQALADIESQRHKTACGITQNLRTVLSSSFNSQKQDILQMEVNSLGSSVCVAELLSDVGLKQTLQDRFGPIDLENIIVRLYPLNTPTEVIDPLTVFTNTNNSHSKQRSSTIVQNPFLISNGNISVYQPKNNVITVDINKTSLLYQHPNLNVPVTIPDAKTALDTHQRYVKINHKKRVLNQGGRYSALTNLCFPIYNSLGVKRLAHQLRDMRCADIMKRSNSLGVYYQSFNYLHGYGLMQSVENVQNITYCVGMMVSKAIIPSIETKLHHINTVVTEKKLGFKNTVRNLFGRKDKHAATFPDVELKCLTTTGKQLQSLWETSSDLMSAASEGIGLFGSGAPHEDCESTKYGQLLKQTKCAVNAGNDTFQALRKFKESSLATMTSFWNCVPCALPISRPTWAVHAFKAVDEVRGSTLIDSFVQPGDAMPITYGYQPYALVIHNTYVPHQTLPLVNANSLEGGLQVLGNLSFVLQDFATSAALLKSHLNDLKTDTARGTIIPVAAPAFAQLNLALAQFLLDTSGDLSLSKDAFEHLELSQALFSQAEVQKEQTKTDSIVLNAQDCIHMCSPSSVLELASPPTVFRNNTKHLPSFVNYNHMTWLVNAIFLDLLVHPSAFPAAVIPIASPKPKEQSAISLFARLTKVQKLISTSIEKEFLKALQPVAANEKPSFVAMPVKIADPSKAFLLAYGFEQAAIACCCCREYLAKKHQLNLFLAGMCYYQAGMFKLSLRCFMSLLPLPAFKATIPDNVSDEDTGLDSDDPRFYTETSLLNAPTILNALLRFMILCFCSLNLGDKAFFLFHMLLSGYKHSAQLTRFLSFYAYSHSITYQERLSARKLRTNTNSTVHKLFHLAAHDDAALTIVNRQLYTSMDSLYSSGVSWQPVYRPIIASPELQMHAINATYSVASQFQTSDPTLLPDGCLLHEKSLAILKFDQPRLHIHAGSQLHGQVATWSDAVALSPETLFRCKANSRYYARGSSMHRELKVPENTFAPSQSTGSAHFLADLNSFVAQFIGGNNCYNPLQFPVDALYSPYITKTRSHTTLRNEPLFISIPVVNPMDCTITLNNLRPRLCYIDSSRNDRIIPYCCTFPAPLVDPIVLSMQPRERVVVQFQITPIAEGTLQLFGFAFTMNDSEFYTPLIEEFPVYPTANMSQAVEGHTVRQRLPNQVSVSSVNEGKAPLLIGRTSTLPATSLSYQSPYGLLGGSETGSVSKHNGSLLERHSALFNKQNTVLYMKDLLSAPNTRHIYPEYAYSTQSVYPQSKDNKHNFNLEALLQGEAAALTYNTPFLVPERSELYPSPSVATTRLPRSILNNGEYSLIHVQCPTSELVVSNAFTEEVQFRADSGLDWTGYLHSNSSVAPYLPYFMLQGGVVTSNIVLTNNGPVPTSKVQFKASHPHMVTFTVEGNELPLNFSDGVVTLKCALQHKESVTVQLTLRGAAVSMNSFSVLIYYMSQDKRERLIRISQPLFVLPCANVHIHQPGSLQLLASALQPGSSAVLVEFEDVRPLLSQIFPSKPDMSAYTASTTLSSVSVSVYLYAVLARLLNFPLQVSRTEVFSLTHTVNNLSAPSEGLTIPLHGTASSAYLSCAHTAPDPLQMAATLQNYISQYQPTASVYKTLRSVLGNIVHALTDSGACSPEDFAAANIHAISGNPLTFRHSVHIGYFPFFSQPQFWSGESSPSSFARMAANEALLWHEAEHCALIVNPRASISSFASLYNSQWFFTFTAYGADVSSAYVPGVFLNSPLVTENPKTNAFLTNDTPSSKSSLQKALLPGLMLPESLVAAKPYLVSLIHKSDDRFPMYTTCIYPPQPLPSLLRPARQSMQHALAYTIQQYNATLLSTTMQLIQNLLSQGQTLYCPAISRTALFPNILLIPNVQQMKGLALLKYLAANVPQTHEEPNTHRVRVLVNDNAVKHVDSYTRLHCLASSPLSLSKAFRILHNPIQAFLTCEKTYHLGDSHSLSIPVTVTLNYTRYSKEAPDCAFKVHFLEEALYSSICTNVQNSKIGNFGNMEEVVTLSKAFSSNSNRSDSSLNLTLSGSSVKSPLLSPKPVQSTHQMPMLQSPKAVIPSLPSPKGPIASSTTLSKANHTTPLPLIPSLQSLNSTQQQTRNIDGVEVVSRPYATAQQFHTQYIAPEHNFGFLVHTSTAPDVPLNAEKGLCYINCPLSTSREKPFDEPLQLVPAAHAEQSVYTVSGPTLQHYPAFSPNHSQSFQIFVHIDHPGIYDFNKLVIELLPDPFSPVSVLHYNEEPCLVQIL